MSYACHGLLHERVVWKSHNPVAKAVRRTGGQAMYAHQTKLASEEIQELRREGGRYVRELREARGLSQRQLANLLGLDFYTFVSQIETGRGRIPPDSYRLWANALDIAPREFVRNLMRFYDPVTYGVLFEDMDGAPHNTPVDQMSSYAPG